MADFVSGFWNWYISFFTLGGIAACWALIFWLKQKKVEADDDGEVKTMGHVWDENLEELNNPLPAWWLNMFYLTMTFGLVYLLLYPGLGSYPGLFGWSQTGQYEKEMEKAEATYGPLFDQYGNQSLKALGAVPEAMKIGERLFVTYCTGCHGSDAGGVTGFPNLRDTDWLWGGSPENIKQTIMYGRNGAMPAWGDALGEDGVKQVADYVMSLGERRVDPASAAAGKQKFAMFCVACHGAEGKGNTALGAPNLTDHVWLYGGSRKSIIRTITEGRNGHMPAHGEFLGESKVHLLAAYIYNLSGRE